MEKHLRHLKYLEALLAKQNPQSNEWWDTKGKLEQVRIAYSQSWNLAVARMKLEDDQELEKSQSYFYDKLTEPMSTLINEAKKK